jgi:hypothetical protein
MHAPGASASFNSPSLTHPPHSSLQEKDTIRLHREAKSKGGFHVEPEAKLAFVMRIRGLNKIHPKVRA